MSNQLQLIGFIVPFSWLSQGSFIIKIRIFNKFIDNKRTSVL